MPKQSVLFIAAALLLTGCRSTQYIDREVTRYVNRTDTMLQRDSVWCHDSVSVYMRGDTIYRDRWRTQNQYHTIYKSKTDTLRLDSIVTQTKVQQVAKPLSWWQRTRMIIGDSSILLLLVFALIRATKKASI